MASSRGRLLWDDIKFSKPSGSISLVTKFFADEMLAQAGITDSYPTDAPLFVFDNACGGAVVTACIHEALSERPLDTYNITCGDFADAMVEATRQRIDSEGWANNTTIAKIDAQNTNLPPEAFTHVFTNFGPMLLPDPDAMLQECLRTLKPGGTCAFTTWKHVGWVEDVKAAMTAQYKYVSDFPPFPNQENLNSAFNSGRWQDADWITTKMTRGHGFQDVRVKVVSNATKAESISELQKILVPILAIVTGKFWTQSQRDRFAGPELESNVLQWFERQYSGRPVVWRWVALVTTAVKPLKVRD